MKSFPYLLGMIPYIFIQKNDINGAKEMLKLKTNCVETTGKKGHSTMYSTIMRSSGHCEENTFKKHVVGSVKAA